MELDPQPNHRIERQARRAHGDAMVSTPARQARQETGVEFNFNNSAVKRRSPSMEIFPT